MRGESAKGGTKRLRIQSESHDACKKRERDAERERETSRETEKGNQEEIREGILLSLSLTVIQGKTSGAREEREKSSGEKSECFSDIRMEG